MTCIAAFIILAIAGIFVAIISIFKPKVGKRYLKMLKKSWGCFGKRITLQKCETGFGDEVKNSVLSRVLLKSPKLVKPLSAAIEVLSILLVVITIWSVVESAKAGLALWSLGTCNVKHAEACTLGSEVCSIDDNSEPHNPIEAIGFWFSDWGEIFAGIPDKFRSWDVNQFDFAGIEVGEGDLKAIDIFDPGCIVCLQSFRTQLETGFFDNGKVLLVPFPIQDNEGVFKYTNSKLVVGYIFGAEKYEAKTADDKKASFEMLRRIYVDKTEYQEIMQLYQNFFNDCTPEEAEEKLKSWLEEFGLDEETRTKISEYARSEEFEEIVKKNNDIVVNNIHAKGIPTMIYDGGRHTGKYEAK